MSEALKPCPFCGSSPSLGNEYGLTVVTCSCDNCILGNMAIAPIVWNTRNDQAVIDGFLARVDDLELEQACDGTLQNPKSYRDLVQDVHAEMFGKEGGK